MMRSKQNQMRQAGLKNIQGFMLLEVLVSILLFALGIMALVGLQARSLTATSDVQYRAEAVHLVNAYVGKMWATGSSTTALSTFPPGGDEYNRFQQQLNEQLPGVSLAGNAPAVTLASDSTLPATSSLVTVTVFWQAPGEDAPHSYTQGSIVGVNAGNFRNI